MNYQQVTEAPVIEFAVPAPPFPATELPGAQVTLVPTAPAPPPPAANELVPGPGSPFASVPPPLLP